ncbi:murein hydrolase activator EnvC family protein [Kitasatospora phosalacinea]|uniref:murein hydrolase activator EnvC family protein n=1 Tax=Kitasatospora phosalacinea TaxID=2065 RepID=UPI000D127CDF|nr:M23 family metallopeptidase [Kitasatospora phosalacinea]
MRWVRWARARRPVALLVVQGVVLVGLGGFAPAPARGAGTGAASVRFSAAGAAGPGRGRAWPVGDRSGLLRRFDPPPARWAAGHRGVDLAAAPGTAVRAAAPGVVTFAGQVAGRPVVVVTHPGSGAPPLRTTYLPVAASAPVGTTVAAGDPIGVVATGSGHCPVDCLHWGLVRGDRYLDPLALLGSGRARLLPLPPP